jgi:outer membrane receptor protein involved in Fe transport
LNNKLNAKHKLRSGIIVSVDNYRMTSDSWNDELRLMENDLNTAGDATTVQAFSSWKWRWNERWTMTSGVHVLHFAVNKSTSVEPRLGLRYQVKPDRAITFGTGLHARTEPVMTYLAQAIDQNGNVYQPNREVGLSKALHLVAGYEQMLATDVQFKAEVYYQQLFDMPVENDPASSFSLVNSVDWFTNRPLVNKGEGRNMGVELALEKFFTRGYHFMITGSLSDAQYKALNGEWHNTRFNMGTVANVLGGKEWGVGKDRVIAAGIRYSMIGGQYSTPIDLPASIAAGYEIESGEPWSEKGDAVHKLDVVLSYRLGKKTASHEFKLDVQNVLNAETAVYRYFDRRTGTIKDVPQLTLLPVLQYTLRF